MIGQLHIIPGARHLSKKTAWFFLLLIVISWSLYLLNEKLHFDQRLFGKNTWIPCTLDKNSQDRLPDYTKKLFKINCINQFPANKGFFTRYQDNSKVTIKQTPYSTAPLEIQTPKIGEPITSPLTIKGQAPGNWFFEDSFPIKITDSTGNTLGSSTAKSIGDWMTSSLVDFTAIITFEETSDTQGFIMFSKDNPSDLPENDQSIKLPIKF